MPRPSVAVLIASYNMGWCLRRAVRSCQQQTHAVDEILIVDDGSSDDTAQVVADLAAQDPRLRALRLEPNQGHLAALGAGLNLTSADWVALLDADDELLPSSIENRLRAAQAYRERTGTTPELIYGDVQGERPFRQVEGDALPFMTRELALCGTSTIMLGQACRSTFPAHVRGYCSDDEIVLAVGKRWPVVHCRESVAIYHEHANATMGKDYRTIAWSVRQLVRNHRADILRLHGRRRLWLWHLRVVRTFFLCQMQAAAAGWRTPPTSSVGRILRMRFLVRYAIGRFAVTALTILLRPFFEYLYV